MSPIALGGAPHSRAASVNVGGPINTSSGGNTMKGNTRVYPHIDDLINVRPDFASQNASIRKVLQDAELLAKQADTHLDFRRPELALQEYMKASILAAEIIPRHKDYPELKGNPELHRAHIGLLKRIHGQDERFDAVIRIIEEDNVRTGVQPSGFGTSKPEPEGDALSRTSAHTRAQSVQSPSVNGKSLVILNGPGHGHNNPLGISGVSSDPSDSVQGRRRPPVQPKPEALHGKAITSPSDVHSDQVDLAARFAKLRRNGSIPPSPIQDSRIRTQPIAIPNSSQTLLESPSTTSSKPHTTIRPSGPREFPSVPTSIPRHTKVVLDLQIPDMPKPPDPIYSPASISDSTPSNNLPSSISRSSSYLSNGRSNAAPPVSRVGRTPSIPLAPDSRQDYFVAAHKVDNPSSQVAMNGSSPISSDESSISAELLYEYIKQGSKKLRVLVVDLRSRQEFDAGHILAPSIICLEPVSLKEGISADEIEESMVLSPEAESGLYKQRREFDIVVFYDQCSTSVNPRSSANPQDTNHLRHFAKAVYDYGYDKQLKRRPKLLNGGLDAWVDLMGPHSLQTLSSGISSTKSAQTLGRVTISRDLYRNPQRKVTRMSVPFTKEEEKKWDDTINDLGSKDAMAVPDSESEEFSYVRSTEDFLQRFPELPSIQESMTSSAPVHPHHQINDIHDGIPNPPTRPAPALPRQRSSGLSERGPTATYAMSSASTSITAANSKAGLTGLRNFGAKTCYLNSVVQSLSSTPVVYNFLASYKYGDIPVPTKARENSPPGQFLTRNLQILFKALRSGRYTSIDPKHFLQYVRELSSKVLGYGSDYSKGFGNNMTQHDVQEFFNFLLDVFLDEVNVRRDRPDWKFLEIPTARLKKYRLMDHAMAEWKNFQASNQSEVFDAISALHVSTLTCQSCGSSSRTWQPRALNVVNIPDPKRSRVGFDTLLTDPMNFGDSGAPDGWTCEICQNNITKMDNPGTTISRIAFMPRYMIFYIQRALNTGGKCNTHIDLDLDNVRLAPIHLTTAFINDGNGNPQGQTPPDGSDRGFHVPTSSYQAYACVMHYGQSVQAGHYVALTRDLDAPAGVERRNWHLFNDRIVTPSTLRYVESDGFHMTLLFLRRKD